MPAVELNRLRAQIQELVKQFQDQPAFQIALRDLLETHANRAYRASQAVQPQPLLPSYRVAPLVLRQLELELGKTCQQYPVQAVKNLEMLWQDPYLEPRLLATSLIGMIPAEYEQPVIQSLRAWAQPSQNFRILEALFKNGTITLRRTSPGRLIELMEEWLTDPRAEVKVMGVRALIPLIEDEAFENLPPVFRILSPLVQEITAALAVDLQITIQALARRAPSETTYFLLQVLTLSDSPGTARLIRRCLHLFEPDQQSSMRAALAAHATR
jgi:hypothetical protein